MDTELVAEKVKAFFSAFPQKRFQKGQVIVQPDQPLGEVFYLTEGEVVQYDISSTGNEAIVNVYGPGTFFPMSTAINQVPNIYFFEADSSVALHVADASKAVAFLKRSPDVTYDLLSRVFDGTDGLIRRMAHLMGGSARTRLLFELINASHRFGKVTSGDQIQLSLSENDFAKRTGLSRETISRMMKELKNDGLVTMTTKSVVVTSLARLEAFLGTRL